MVSLIKYGALGGGEKYETNVMTFDGLSSDDLPVGTFEGMAIPNGSSYCETDTGVKYLYDEENEEWYEQPSGGGGGGGGTDNYNDLSNKPKINGVTLTGDKSLSALDILSNTTFEEFLSALQSYLDNEVQPKITSQNRLSANLVEEENDKYFASEDELDKIDAILNGQDYFVGAIPLESGDDMNDLAVGKYMAEYPTTNIANAPTVNSFVAFMIETTPAGDQFLQIAYTLNSASWYLRHGAEINGQRVWGQPWMCFVPEYGNNHLLLADYVTDVNQTNKFVTAAEKTAISTIGDKVDKVTGKGLSTNDYTTAEKNKLEGIEAQANKTVVDSAFSGSSTNPVQNKVIKSAIDTVANLGAKNLFDINATPIVNHTNYTLTNGKLTVSADGNWAHYSIPTELPKGDYILSTVISGYSKASGAPDTSVRIRVATSTSGGTTVVLETISQNGLMTIPFTWQGGSLYVQFYPNYNGTSYSNSFAVENVMFRPAFISDSTYQPYAMSNAELTAAIQAIQAQL